jgi:hypothetical protein
VIRTICVNNIETKMVNTIASVVSILILSVLVKKYIFKCEISH